MNRPVEAGQLWYIEAAGQVWGPYPEARLVAFVEEGRVAPDTLTGPRPEGPFAPAAHQARLRRLFGEAEVAAPSPAPAAIQPEAPEAPLRHAAPSAESQTRDARALLVWAALKSQRPDRFEALLGAFGPFVVVQPGLWLVRAAMEPPALRNALTRRLEAGDRLMVVEAALDRAAWFNLDPEADRQMRQVWTGQ